MPSNWVQICVQGSPDFSPCVPKLGVKLGPFAPVSQHTRQPLKQHKNDRHYRPIAKVHRKYTLPPEHPLGNPPLQPSRRPPRPRLLGIHLRLHVDQMSQVWRGPWLPRALEHLPIHLLPTSFRSSNQDSVFIFSVCSNQDYDGIENEDVSISFLLFGQIDWLTGQLPTLFDLNHSIRFWIIGSTKGGPPPV